MNAETQDVFEYIKSEEVKWKTERVPLTNSKDWSMYEHIQRCTNVSNGWFHSGKNDGLRPYNDLVTPIINVAFRSEGFDAKDIVPYVNDAANYYKSFLVKKYHPRWARAHQLDTFIDEVVETSVIYDLVLVKDVSQVRPEVVDLKTIAFCDQSDVLSAPLCIRHQYTPSELNAFRAKWNSEAIDIAIKEATQVTKVSIADDQTAQTNTKYIEVYELRGQLPSTWLDKEAGMFEYSPQMHIVCFYTDSKGGKSGLVLFQGKDKPLDVAFKALKIDQVRSKGRACGRSIVETLFEPQVWNNYAGIKIKDLLDSAITVFQTSSDTFGNQKLTDLATNTVLKHEDNRPVTKLDGTVQNLPAFTNYQNEQAQNARILGSASEGSLGQNPVSGTPFALQALIVQEGQGIHDYRQGKIATFFADVLYPSMILKYLVRDMNKGKKFAEDLSLDELQEIADTIVTNEVNQDIKNLILEGKEVSPEIMSTLFDVKKKTFMKGGTRRFFEILENELEDIPLDVYVNIKGKQKRTAENADKLSNMISFFLRGGVPITALAKPMNELLEDSGLSPIDFSAIVSPIQPTALPAPIQPNALPEQPLAIAQ